MKRKSEGKKSKLKVQRKVLRELSKGDLQKGIGGWVDGKYTATCDGTGYCSSKCPIKR